MPTYHYNINGEQIAVQIERDAGAYRVVIGEREVRVADHSRVENMLSFTMDGQHRMVALAYGEDAADRHVWFNGQSWSVEKVDPRKSRRRGGSDAESGALAASMPGQVREILVAVGDSVAKGDALVLLEAMKMEMRIAAPADGVVTAINCAVEDVVARGTVLVVVSDS